MILLIVLDCNGGEYLQKKETVFFSFKCKLENATGG